MQLETKYLALTKAALELKAEDGQPTTLSGYGSTFSALDGTGEPDSYGDLIAPGAFAKSIAEWQRRSYPLPMLFNHDANSPIGVWSHMAEDGIGLRLEGTLTPGHSLARDVEASIRHRAISGLSIGFRTQRASQGPNGTRILEDLDLFEVSAVTFPANRLARLTGVKSTADEIDSLRDFEKFLRESGWSRREATAIASQGFKVWLAVRDEQRQETPPQPSNRRDDGSEAARVLAALRELRLTPS